MKKELGLKRDGVIEHYFVHCSFEMIVEFIIGLKIQKGNFCKGRDCVEKGFGNGRSFLEVYIVNIKVISSIA